MAKCGNWPWVFSVVLEGIESKKRMRRYLTVICVISFLSAGSCPVVYISPPAPMGQALLWEVEAIPDSIDPHVAFWDIERLIISNVYETLIQHPLMYDSEDEFDLSVPDISMLDTDGWMALLYEPESVSLIVDEYPILLKLMLN